MATLVKVSKNGNKHWADLIKCEKCNGTGYIGYYASIYGGICFDCDGRGKIEHKWIEYTPEYIAKQEAKRAKEQEKYLAEKRAKEEKEKAEQEKREAELKAKKAVSQYVGEIGNKINSVVTLVKSTWWEQPAYCGFGTDTMYCHIFKDENGNVLVWKTANGLGIDEGAIVNVKGTIKDHKEYKEEKQTVLTRCKVQA